MISFGPVPSRRLGKSLGINNISSGKVCSYSCVYCQVGITKEFRITRGKFYNPDIIFDEVQRHLKSILEKDMPDYLTFVANGEPTLDINLGKSIEKLKAINIPIAVITNGTLLRETDVRNELQLADWVSIKVDANSEQTWKLINKPIADLSFNRHVEGLLQFASEYRGKLVTETMLVKGINDNPEILNQTSDLVKQISPSLAYLSIPTRPPAISGIKVPAEPAINEAFQIFSNKGLNIELLLGFEGTDTGFTGNVIEDILNICAVHPIREDTMMELLFKDKADIHVLNSLIRDKLIKKVCYQSNTFYIRQLNV
ncbi:MAG TPA: radical SAM protein [Bacteroidales bacterium]|nr:MAG: radical SAM protein [Bacteroidetes bacterium GWE2_42_24]OFY26361.1 MAG: radical SAM protein [Bacteroidetes bacterium GWF2_43_11]HAQ65576.1 radical SAM protein [Bacteroidales bacterium]HBZ66880.1 radical SAM protein [Bacteroidales bacterium]